MYFKSYFISLLMRHNSPLLRRCLAWKRRKKWRCSKRIFKEYDWDPGAALMKSPDQFLHHFQFQYQLVSACLPVSSFLVKGEGM